MTARRRKSRRERAMWTHLRYVIRAAISRPRPTEEMLKEFLGRARGIT